MPRSTSTYRLIEATPSSSVVWKKIHSRMTTSGARLNVHRATLKSIKRCVRSQRRRIMKAQRLNRRLVQRMTSKNMSVNFDLAANNAGVTVEDTFEHVRNISDEAGLLKKSLSTDSDELEVDVSSEEDQEEAKALMFTQQVERGFEVDSGCDEWDLSKKL